MPALHRLLAARRSPRAFDPQRELSAQHIDNLLEAARWAPSSKNSQPWRFIVGRRGSRNFKAVFDTLHPHNQRWAHAAGLLVVGAYTTHAEDGSPLSHGMYDLGQATAHLSFQAAAEGLWAHQMGGFDPALLRAEFALAETIVPAVTIAVGHLGDLEELPDDLRKRESAPRTRLAVDQLLIGDRTQTD